ncbi:MAG: DUF6460 domain-containing protein [Parvibaculum sp.]|nr:DUF6460 domain-containing protein [Parvibaculum sp.]
MNRFFGGPIVPTLFKLAVASIAVGVVLAVFGIKPTDLWRDFLDTVSTIWAMGFDAIDWSLQYLLLGAVVVIPIFIAVRLWSVLVARGKKE